MKLGELMASDKKSVDPRKFPNDEFELFSIPAYDQGKPERILGSEIGSSKQILQPNDVLISRIVPHIRRSWVVPESNGLLQIGSSEWIIFRANDFYPKYLRHYLLSDQFNAQFMSTVAGVGGSLLRARPVAVAKLEISLPDINEQKRIATILDKASEISQNTEQAFEKREGLKNSVFIELFGDPLNTSQWQKVSFLDGVQDVTRSQSKIPQKEFLESGVLPIIDQGRQNIGGWTNDPSVACNVPLPNIIFGDHTGVLKFLDFPYALGADGVKVLIPKDLNFEPFFLYHLLRFLPLPDVGYSRHYKFLKQFMLICPPIQLQRKFERIVNSINQMSESAGLAKENAQSILQEMLI